MAALAKGTRCADNVPCSRCCEDYQIFSPIRRPLPAAAAAFRSLLVVLQ